MDRLQKYFEEKKEILDKEMDKLLPSAKDEPVSVHKSIRYTTFLPGKRIRPIMMLAIYEMFKADENLVLPAACAIEMIHSSSLILDDLPSMDDAMLRRGKKANHIVFGEDIAILAAFGLLNLAFETVSKMNETHGLPARRINEILRVMTYAIGSTGLIGGQALDLQGEGKKLNFDQLEFIHSRKTGALFTASGQIACILAGAGERHRTAIELYTKNLGLAFQVVDDILDATADTKTLGKDIQKDTDKTTFVSFCSIDEAGEVAQELIDFSIQALQRYGSRAEILRDLAKYVVERKY